MRYAFLVALREFAENAKTKGFWIGIFIFPLLIWASISASGWLEKVKPVRNFVLVDRSKTLDDPIKTALERLYQREVMRNLEAHQRKYMRTDLPVPDLDLDKLSADLIKKGSTLDAGDPEAVDSFIENGGHATELTRMKLLLRADAPPFEPPKSPFRRVDLPQGVNPELPFAELIEALKPQLRGDESIEVEGKREELFAAILVPEDIHDHIVRPGDRNTSGATSKRDAIQYWSANLADDDLKDEIEQAVNEEIRRAEYARCVDPAKLAEVQAVQKTHVPVAALNPKKEVGSEDVSMGDQIRQWAPVGFVYLLWIAIFTIAQMLLNNTIEEKSNRIIEVLLSSVTAGELMMGKLFGIAAVGLTMIGAWIASLVVILNWKAGPETRIVNEILGVLQSSNLLYAFVVYFLLGYLLYAGVFLAIGSLCNTLKEAQNMMGPVMVIMMVPLMTMMFIPKDPNGTLATVLSWIPIYTPFVMMNRAAADPPMFERVGTLILLVVTTIGMLWLSGRIFRAAILRTGQPPKFMELLRWVKSA